MLPRSERAPWAQASPAFGGGGRMDSRLRGNDEGAGMTEGGAGVTGVLFVIPAKAGSPQPLSGAGEFLLPQERRLSSFPRRRESSGTAARSTRTACVGALLAVSDFQIGDIRYRDPQIAPGVAAVFAREQAAGARGEKDAPGDSGSTAIASGKPRTISASALSARHVAPASRERISAASAPDSRARHWPGLPLATAEYMTEGSAGS